LVSAAKFLVAATKNLFVVPNFVAVTKLFFPSTFSNLLAGKQACPLSLISFSQ